MSNETYKDYEDIRHLLKQDEWKVWVSFIEGRRSRVLHKMYQSVKNEKYTEAYGYSQVAEELDKQILHFRNLKGELESRFNIIN